MIEVVLTIASQASNIGATFQALASVMLPAKLEPSCVDCRLYVEIENPESLRDVEQWSNLQDVESQLHSQRFGRLLAIMAPEAPELEVRTVSEHGGLEYIRSVRPTSCDTASAEAGFRLISNLPTSRTRGNAVPASRR